MSKTTVHFLKKNRQISNKKIKASSGFMEFNKGYYIVSPGAINRISKNGVMKKGSEMFFFEGNSSPIPLKKPRDIDPDPSAKYLNDMIYVNFLEQTGDPRSEQFKSTLSKIQALSSPSALIKVILALLVVGTLARSWILNIVSGF